MFELTLRLIKHHINFITSRPDRSEYPSSNEYALEVLMNMTVQSSVWGKDVDVRKRPVAVPNMETGKRKVRCNQEVEGS